jgi:hypothetical protein
LDLDEPGGFSRRGGAGSVGGTMKFRHRFPPLSGWSPRFWCFQLFEDCVDESRAKSVFVRMGLHEAVNFAKKNKKIFYPKAWFQRFGVEYPRLAF